MTEGITVMLSPQWNTEAVRQLFTMLEEASKEQGVPIHINPLFDDSDDDYADDKRTNRRSKEDSVTLKEALGSYLKENKRELAVKAIKQGEVAISSSLKKGFGIVEEIYGKLKASSPLLQSVESLFNLAMTLFFMPLGNKLAEVLIPATVELVENMVGLYDKFEGKSLTEIFSIMVNEGVKLFAEYFNNIGATLKEQGGLIGSIGDLLETVGAFIQGPGIGVLNMIFSVTTLVLGHLKEFISLYIALKTAELAMQATGALGWVGANAAIFAGVAAALAGGLAYGGLSAMGMASGGEVKATPGGQLRLLGEGGEDEYVVPKSQAGDFASRFGGGSSQQIVNNFYGYNEDQLIQTVNDVISQQVSQGRLRSGF